MPGWGVARIWVGFGWVLGLVLLRGWLCFGWGLAGVLLGIGCFCLLGFCLGLAWACLVFWPGFWLGFCWGLAGVLLGFGWGFGSGLVGLFFFSGVWLFFVVALGPLVLGRVCLALGPWVFLLSLGATLVLGCYSCPWALLLSRVLVDLLSACLPVG